MITSPQDRIRWEFEQLDLGDERRNQRACMVLSRFMENPDGAFESTFETAAEVQGLHRLLENEHVGLSDFIQPHVTETHRQMATQSVALIVHDSSECYFPNAPSDHDIGYLGSRCGLLVHTALAVSADERHIPLGVVGILPISRSKPQRGVKKTRQKYRTKNPHCGKESKRWGALITRVEKDAQTSLIHVMDREGDIYELLSDLTMKQRRFVVRMRRDRRIDNGDMTVLNAFESIPFLGQCEVPLSKRNNEQRPRNLISHPSREARVARLEVRAQKVILLRPQHTLKNVPERLELTAVQVIEPSPPEGEAPINWTLLTSETAETSEQAWQIVSHYRGRWRIEEYFKALKTGCAFEKRAMETLDSVLHLLGIMAPIAWQMLAARALLHHSPNAPASSILRQTQIDILQARRRVGKNPSLYEALLAIAEMGGHRRRRKEPPGWLTLSRGFEKLDSYEVGWIMALQKM